MVDALFRRDYNNVMKHCKGGTIMRRYYLDNIRWMTVVVVVLYHVLYMFNAEGVLGGLGKITSLDVQYYDIYMYIVYPWIMPVLFLVSGISARYALEKQTDGEFLRKRTVRLLVPSTIGLFVFQFLQGYVSMSLGDAFETMSGVPAPVIYLIMVLSGIGVLWYIQLLWVFSLFLVLLRKIEKDRLHAACKGTSLLIMVLLAVPIWAAAQILNTPVIIVYRFGFYGLVFLIGYFVFSHEETIGKLKKWCIPFLLGAAVLGILFCLQYFGSNFADTPINRTPLFTSYAWFACLAILGCMVRFGDFTNGFTRWMGSRSFGLYVFHYLCISSVALFFGKTGRLPAPAVYLLSLIAGFAGGYLLNAVISRIPFFRWAVLGISKKEKKNV